MLARTFLVTTIAIACGSSTGSAKGARDDLRVVIVRHGEKPDAGDSLSCQGFARALALPGAIVAKIGKPDALYVPALALGATTSHARMFQTATPLAVKLGLPIDTRFGEKDAAGVAADLMKRGGTVLLVWEHSAIPDVAAKLGIASPPEWKKHDFDSIWIITYEHGVASLAVDHEGITPSADCRF